MRRLLFLMVMALCISAAQADIETGLVAYYDFEDLSGTLGETIVDRTGNGHDGESKSGLTTLVAPRVVEGPPNLGNALDFNYDNFVEIPNSTDFDAVSAFTLAFWVNLDTVVGTLPTMFCRGDRSWRIAVNADSLVAFHTTPRGNHWGMNSSVSLADPDRWVHVVGTWNGATQTMTIFIDGEEDVTFDKGLDEIDAFDNPVSIGAQIHDGTTLRRLFDGQIDEVRFYNRALSATDVQELYGYTGRGAAHTPTPNGTVFSYDVLGLDDPNWLSPLQDKDGVVVGDPNIVSVDKYEVWWSVGEEPNFVTDTPYDNGTSQTYDLSVAGEAAIAYDTTYFWRVDTTVTWDSNEITGNFTDVLEGSLWSFTTEPAYTPPVIETYDNVISTLDIGGGDLSATITGNSDAIASVTWTLVTDDAEFPAGSDAVVIDTTTDTQNPTAQLTTTYEGAYIVKLVIDDGSGKEGSVQEAIAEVTVYADACEAQKAAPSGWTANPFDLDDNCVVDLLDFLVFAAEWLDDTSMDVQESYAGSALYVPQAVYDARIDAVADIIDPNVTCSDAPITDTTGLLIETSRPNATDSTNLGNAGTGSWVEYEITVDAGTYDVYAGYSQANGELRTIDFGIEDDSAKYGTDSLPYTGSWDTFWGLYVGEVTFTESGTQTLRLTFQAYSNLDWFAFDPQ